MFLIAEAGVNHGGRLSQAMKLADAAKFAGADAVKYQLFRSAKLWGDDRIKHLELSFDEIDKLHQHCVGELGIEFMCTPFGVEELQFLEPLLMRVKIASGCIARKPLLEAVAETGLPVLLSTGMSTLNDIEQALGWLKHTPGYYVGAQRNITLLHCTSSYPCRLEDVNLKAMDTLRWQWGEHPQKTFPSTFICDIGLSDHTTGITAAIASAAMGATVIEKHLTLDRDADGPDHKASITPREFKALHLALIEVAACLGNGGKSVLPCEVALHAAWRGN